MKIQRYPPVGLALLGSALVLLWSNVMAATSMTSAECLENSVSDGFCDDSNNNDQCGYDGGDCCGCTCVSGDFSCDENLSFNCLDPSASCFDDDTDSSKCDLNFISDGDCDFINNTDECGYDGGDCCECTCVSTSDFTCGDPSFGGFACVDPSASCVDDDDVTTLPEYETFSDSGTTTTTGSCLPNFISDGDCDPTNNNGDCDYDGGDCCQCTCVSTELFTCGSEDHGGFACIDPRASCVDDDDFTMEDDMYFDYDDDFSASYSFEPCSEEFMGDGDCDASNNNEECGYDGGDCCECTCVSTDALTCGLNGFDCVDPSSSCSGGLVEAGTKTTVGVSASSYDTSPGLAGGGEGCLVDGCAPELTRDGITGDSDSRWSCSRLTSADNAQCEIAFTFEDLQDIVDIEVAFWMGDEVSRRIQVTVNGDVIGNFGSQPGSTFTALGIEATGVSSVEFRAQNIRRAEFIEISEVRFMVEA